MADIDVDIWYAMYAPAATPPAVVAKLNADVNRLLKSPDVAATLSKQGLTPTGGSAEQLGELTRKDLERWAKVVRDAKISAD